MRRTPSAHMLFLLCTLAWLSVVPPVPTIGASSSTSDELLRGATLVFRHALNRRSAAIPASIMVRARGVAVFPAVRADGGVYYGMGVMSARGATPVRWTPPAVLALDGVIDADIDLESPAVDIILIALTPRGLDYLSQDQLAPVTRRIYPGPLGQETVTELRADLLGYMRFDDYFAGVSLYDWTIVGMNAANQQLYGRAYSTDDIVRGAGFFNPPPAAQDWRNAIAAYFREMS